VHRNPTDVGRRRIGSLEVSTVGLGCQTSADELQELNVALAGITIQGDRLPAPVLAPQRRRSTRPPVTGG
jgi:hypothetical protein